VLCITHLPQIAARGGTQFRISKEVKGGRTATTVERLSHSAREVEVARMIGGAFNSAAVLASAREMLAIGAGNPLDARPGRKAKAKGERRKRKSRQGESRQILKET
jgi:hypothetical protein